MTNNLFKMAEEHVTTLFKSHEKPELIFHSLAHTQEIVKRVQEIAAHYKLDDKDMTALYLAAWFHDTGYLFTAPEHHEEQSVEQLKIFMNLHRQSPELINVIAACIMSTKMNSTPNTLLEQILCDADTYHVGTSDFKKTDKRVRKEMSVGHKIPKKEWDFKALDFLERHKFYTAYCLDLLSKGKEDNIKTLKKKIADNTVGSEEGSFFVNEKPDETKISKQANSLLNKGIQTMLRTASSNHLRLSYMADRKANILISVNAIIISVSISVLFRKLDENPYLIVPTIIFLVFSVVTIVISILATRPTITSGSFSREDITSKKANLLFFGNFYKATLEEYNWGMGIMMRDPDYLYGSLIKDVYHLGVVLAGKYKLLRIAYNIFMVGIVISVVAFTIAVFIRSPESTTVITSPKSSPL